MSKELGTLVVVVLKARNLKDKHLLYKQDVFGQISLNGPPKRTAVDVKGGQHPVWDEEIRISVPKDASGKNRTLEVSCWAKEPRTEDLLGQGKVDISETLRTGEFDDWIKLEINGVYRGDIYLEMTFYASAPANLARRASKLDPKERLARPNLAFKYDNASSSSSPPSSNGSSPLRNPTRLPQTSPKGNHLLPPSSRSPSASPKNRNDALPPLPRNGSPPSSRTQVPPSLAAATASGGTKPRVPSILRPGNPKSSPIPIVPSRPDLDDQRQSHSQYRYPQTSTQTIGQPLSPHVNAGPSPSVSFPVPLIPNAHSPVYDPPPQYTFRPYQQTAYEAYPSPEAHNEPPHPSLIARYQHPLPLPASSGPPRQAPARRDPAAEAAEIRRQAVLQEGQEKARKRAQEEADAELARQLDRELNSGNLEQERSRTGEAQMPGAW